MLLINYTPGIDSFSNYLAHFFRYSCLTGLKNKKIYGVQINVSCKHTVQINCSYVCNNIVVEFCAFIKAFTKFYVWDKT
jgi:hypothetical protein